MNITDEIRAVLEEHGYSTSPAGRALVFEDDSLAGFVWQASSVDEIINECQRQQDNFLRLRDSELRKAGRKSWNLYAVLVTEAEATHEQQRLLANIEEDFRGTRKIVAYGLLSPTDLKKAIYPLISIQAHDLLQIGHQDAADRLKARLSFLSTPVLNGVLSGATAEEIVRLMMVTDEDNPH